MSDYKIETKCIQSGYKPGNGEPRVLPIYQSTTFKYNSSDQMGRLFDLEESGYFYTRLQNPTNDALQRSVIWRVEWQQCLLHRDRQLISMRS